MRRRTDGGRAGEYRSLRRSLGALRVQFDLERDVVFQAAGDDIALFTQPGPHFPRAVLETIRAGEVIASLGGSPSANVRRLRLRDPLGEVIFDRRIPVYLT